MVDHLVIPLLAVTALGASPLQMGALTAADSAAFLLVGLPAGALLDRVRKIPVMITADLVRLLLLSSVPVAWWLGVLTFGQLLVVVLLVGLATVFFDVSYQSVLPALVGRRLLLDGNAKLESTRAVSQVAGPALGGGLVQVMGAAIAVLVDALTYLVSAVLLARVRSIESTLPRTGRRLRAEMLDGLRYVLGHPLLRPIALCTGTATLFGGVLTAVSTLFLARELTLPAGIIGLVILAGGVGGVLGAVTASSWVRRLGQARVVVGTLLVTAPPTLLIPLAGPGPRLACYVVGMFAVGYGAVVYNVAQVSFRQAVCPDGLLSRMNASVRFLVWGPIPLGGLLGGALGELFGLRATLLVAVVGSALAPGWLLASPLRRLRDLPAC